MPTALGLTTTTAQSKSSNRSMNNTKERLNTISKRNHAAAIEVETLLWRALCDSPDAAKEYLAEDCIMINPLFSGGSSKPMSKHSDPSIDQILDNSKTWTSFRMHEDMQVVEVDLMAISVLYKISLYRQTGKRHAREVVATVSSSWRQTAGADWLLCSQHVAYADDDDEDDEDDDDE